MLLGSWFASVRMPNVGTCNPSFTIHTHSAFGAIFSDIKKLLYSILAAVQLGFYFIAGAADAAAAPWLCAYEFDLISVGECVYVFAVLFLPPERVYVCIAHIAHIARNE